MTTRRQSTSFVPPCDQCLFRKIRCDKSLPCCRQCLDASLACTRDVVRRRPGRKKGSGLVISRLRTQDAVEGQPWNANCRPMERRLEFERQIVPGERQDWARRRSDSDTTSRRSSGNSNGSSTPTIHAGTHFTVQPGNPPSLSPPPIHLDSPTHRVSGFEPAAVIANLPNLSRHIDLFFADLYPIWPIVHETSFRESLSRPEELDHHQTCLILSICALTALHIPGSTAPAAEPRRVFAQRFIEQCLQIRASFDYIGTASLVTIQTSLFLSCAEVEFQRARSSWFLLRESIVLAQELGFYEAGNLSPIQDRLTVISLQRTLYLLSLTERGITLLRNKPFTIILFDSPPEEPLEGEDPRILVGLQSLSRLFSLLDRQFLETWVNGNEGAAAAAEATAKVLGAQETLVSARFDVDNLTDIQKADVLITQQWLRLVFWQSSMRQGLLSSAADEQALTYHFPCEIAKSLCGVLETLPMRPILIHGMAIFERIFEIAFSFIDSLSLSHSLTSGLDELRILFRVLRDSPNSHTRYIQILEAKLIEQAGDESNGLLSLLYRLPSMKT